MGDRKQPNPPPGTPGSTAPAQRRPDPPPPPPPKRADGDAPAVREGLQLGDEVVDRMAVTSHVMSVAGLRDLNGGRQVLCTWMEGDGQAYHEWIPQTLLTLSTGPKALPSTVVPLRHVRCGNEVSIAVLRGDVAYYVWCETCQDLVEEGELHPPVDETKVRLRVARERVRLGFNGETPTTETREVQA